MPPPAIHTAEAVKLSFPVKDETDTQPSGKV